jgi:hypothetical protein
MPSGDVFGLLGAGSLAAALEVATRSGRDALDGCSGDRSGRGAAGSCRLGAVRGDRGGAQLGWRTLAALARRDRDAAGALARHEAGS